MAQYRIAEAAELLGISDDTMRRIAVNAELAVPDSSGRLIIEGTELAKLAEGRARAAADPTSVGRSARNRLVGLVTGVTADAVMAQVEMQCGPHRVVSLMSTEALEELGLQPGDLAVAVIKSTMVTVETPGRKPR